MAATRLIALHKNKGKSVARSIHERLLYTQDPEKTEGGALVTSYECDPHSAWAQFLLEKNAYHQKYGRECKGDIIAYQIRQSFKPGEITPEEANEVGRELAMRFTKGKHAFTVSTHVDRKHVHNHIVFNAVSLDGEKKFRNFYLSGRAVAKLSDIICLEHGLSIITPKPKKERTPYYYPNSKKRPFDLMVDMEKILREQKGPAYESWAKDFNLKQAAEVLIFIQENDIHSREELRNGAKKEAARFHELSAKIKEYETELNKAAEFKKAIITYVKTKDTYDAYKKSGYSPKFFEKHRQDITLHKAAKKNFDEYAKTGKPLPRIKDLTEHYDEILNKKREAYQEYREARSSMKTWQIAEKNIELLFKNQYVDPITIEREKRLAQTRSHREER